MPLVLSEPVVVPVLPLGGGVGVTAFCGVLPFANWMLALNMLETPGCIPLRAIVSPSESGRMNRQNIAATPTRAGRDLCLRVPMNSRNAGGKVTWLAE